MRQSHRLAPITRGTFTVSGVPICALYPRRVAVTWSRGESLSGDPGIIADAGDRALLLEDPISAAVLLETLFISGTVSISGDVPRRSPVPPGAVG
jgi:hypothetical protein